MRWRARLMASRKRPDWSRPLHRSLVIPVVLTLKTLPMCGPCLPSAQGRAGWINVAARSCRTRQGCQRERHRRRVPAAANDAEHGGRRVPAEVGVAGPPRGKDAGHGTANPIGGRGT